MKKTMHFSALFTVLLFTAFTAPATAQDLKSEMDALGKAWQDANNRADVATLMTMHTNEVVFVDPKDGSTTTSTKQQIEADFIKDFSESDNQIAIKVEKAEAQPDGKARIAGTFSGVSTNKKSGEKTSYAGSYEHLVVKENGQWKLCQMKSW